MPFFALASPFLALPLPSESPQCSASAVQINAIPCHRSDMQFHAVALLCCSVPRYASALLLQSFRCYAFSQLIEADPLLHQSKPCLRLAFPRLSIASLSMPTQGVSIHCRCAAYLSNASPLLRCTRLFVATPLLHFAAPQRLIRSLPIRTGPYLLTGCF